MFLEKIAIVLATYNPNVKYFSKQIASLKAQNYQNWVCYLVDDNSLPENKKAIQEIIGKDKRFILKFYTEQLGSYHNFERGLQLCYKDREIGAIAFCDQDDIWHRDKLKVLQNQLRENQAVLAHSDLEIIDINDIIIYSSCWKFEGRNPEKLTTNLLLLKNTITGCSLIFCANLLPFILPFPKPDKINWYHDHWVALIASCRGKIVHNRQPLVQYRQHSVNVVGATQDVGSFYRELGIWLKQKGRITGNSYLVHKTLSDFLYNRLDKKNGKNPFDERVTDFGLRILLLGIYSFVVNYKAEGTAARVFVLKFLFDLNKLLKIF